MSGGMQIFDASGNVILDSTSVVGRLIGVIDASAVSGSATFAGLDQGTPFAIPQLLSANTYGTLNTNSFPVCTFVGTTVSWTRHQYPAGSTLAGCNLILGVR